MKAKITNNWKEGFPVELIGQIVEVDENGVIQDGMYKGSVLNKKEYKKLYKQEPDELLQKVLNGEYLEEDELAELFYEYDDLIVDEDEGENRRWSCFVTKTLNIFGRFFDVSGDIGLTESQESYFGEQPVEYLIEPKVKKVEVFSFNFKKKGEDK